MHHCFKLWVHFPIVGNIAYTADDITNIILDLEEQERTVMHHPGRPLENKTDHNESKASSIEQGPGQFWMLYVFL